MQRVSSLLPIWDRNSKSSNTLQSKSSLDKVRGWADKIPSPVARFSNARLSRELFWPATLDKECDKAARIIKSFCHDGFSAPDTRPSSVHTSLSSHSSSQFLKKIPPRILQNALGLAVFTSMRSGLWTSGSGGSGILIARKTDGSWSPPSALMLQTPSLGFVLGVDIYDCVLIINNFTVLEIFARQKFTIGTDVGLMPGPLVSLGLLENDLRWTDLSDTVMAYVKAKGQLAEIKLDGTALSERADENERFYGMKISVPKILAGDINQSLPQTRSLTEVLKAAEGRTDYDTALVEHLSAQPAPGDAAIESPTGSNEPPPVFGIPDVDDPDPFGVVALEMAGMEIREAGSRLRPESSQFDYSPSPSSPIFPRISRRSVDTYVSRSNRGSYMSSRTIATERSQMTDTGTQTFASTPETTPSQSEDGYPRHANDEIPEVKEPEEVDYTKIDISALRKLSNFPDLEEKPTTTISRVSTIEEQEGNEDTISLVEKSEDKAESANNVHVAVTEEDAAGVDDSQDEADVEDEDDDDEFEDAEEAVVIEVATAQPPQRIAMVASHGVQAKGAMVTIPRRVPPPLPARSPARSSRQKSQMTGEGMVSSPLRQEFDLEPESEDVVTPKAQDAAADPVEQSVGDITVVQKEELPTTESEVKIVEQLATPTADSQDAGKHSSEVEDRSPKRDSAVVQTSLDAEEQMKEQTKEQANLTTSHGVEVSVA